MKNLEYESPRFDFQELKLMERVADTCWGFHYGWYDADGDGVHDSNETIKLDNFGSCKSVEDGLVKYIYDTYGQVIKSDDVKTNTKSELVKPIQS